MGIFINKYEDEKNVGIGLICLYGIEENSLMRLYKGIIYSKSSRNKPLKFTKPKCSDFAWQFICAIYLISCLYVLQFSKIN